MLRKNTIDFKRHTSHKQTVEFFFFLEKTNSKLIFSTLLLSSFYMFEYVCGLLFLFTIYLFI